MNDSKPVPTTGMGGFAAGTLVHTKDGLRPIEQIKVGDWVLSKNITARNTTAPLGAGGLHVESI